MCYPVPFELRPPLRYGLEWTKEVDLASDSADLIERWTAQRRLTMVASLLKGEISVAEGVRKHGLTVTEMSMTLLKEF